MRPAAIFTDVQKDLTELRDLPGLIRADVKLGLTTLRRLLEQKVAGRTLTCRYRWFNRVPLRDGADARLVDWVGVTITDAKV